MGIARHAWIAAALAGCAATAPKPSPDAWLFKPGWIQAADIGDVVLRGANGQTHRVQGAHLANLGAVLLALGKQSGIDPRLVLVAGDAANAFATVRDGTPLIGLTLPMLDGIGPDSDALATTMGHELAHLKLDHGNIRKQRAKSARGVGDVLGTILDATGIPLGGAIASIGVGMVTTAYSRDEEREADALGLEWAIAAGYSACGSVRTLRILKMQGDGAPVPFLASHPNHDERMDRAGRAEMSATGHGC